MRRSLCCVLLLSFLLVIESWGDNGQSKLDALVRWADETGFERNVDLVYISAEVGAGAVASSDLEEGQLLVKAPRGATLTLERARAELDWDGWNESVVSEPLMIYILKQRLQPDGPFKAYVDALPDSFHNHPSYWAPEDYDILGPDTKLARYCRMAHDTLMDSFQRVSKSIAKEKPDWFPPGYFVWPRYLWAFLAVNTRAWTTTVNGKKSLEMVPLVDMLNHHPSAKTGDVTEEFFTTRSATSYQKGQQVFISYGPKGNADLLQSYGFTVENNPYDSVDLNFGLRPDTNIVHSILQPVLNHRLPELSSVTLYRSQAPHDLLRLFRISTLKMSEVDKLDELLERRAISLENEYSAYRAAISAISRLRGTYPTEAELDEKSQTATPQQKQVIQLTRNDLQVLEIALDQIRIMWYNLLLEGTLPGGVSI